MQNTKTNHYTNLISQAEKLRRHNRQGSFKTKQRYFEAFQRFLRYVANEYRLEKLANISGKHLSSYLENMYERDMAISTIKTDFAAIRFWHDQIPDAKYVLPSNDEFELERRKFVGTDRTWTDGELNRMIFKCWEAKRDDYEACIIIARYVGLRLHEVMRIDTAVAHAALKNEYITIKGKGGKIREIPLPDQIRVEFEKFLKCTMPGQKLFVPQNKQTHIAMKELQNFISTHRKAVQDPDSTRPMTFHGLRHTCAAEWFMKLIGQGMTDNDACLQISKWLGHERPEITRIYLASVLENGGHSHV